MDTGPGQGVRKNANLEYSAQKPFSSLHWRTQDNKRYMWMIWDKMYLYDVQFRNDSIIYTSLDYTYETDTDSGTDFPLEINGQMSTILIDDDLWCFDGSMLYTFNESTRHLRVVTVGGSILTNGFSKIYRNKDGKIDIFDPSTLLFLIIQDWKWIFIR